MQTITYSKNLKASSADLIRHEAKYVIHPSLVPQIMDFIEPFCELDPHCRGTPPEYVVTTLHLDTPDLALHHAKDVEALDRFKLRVRTYGLEPVAPVFLEIKQKHHQVSKKTRASIAADKWCEDIIRNPAKMLVFRHEEEEICYLNFVRLVRELGAEPVVLVRYLRTSYFGRIDHYARVTFDRNITYQPTRSWDFWNTGDNWLQMDSSLTQNRLHSFSGTILELKTLCDAPQWMIDLVENFGLERCGHCKYSNALWEEALFRGTPDVRVFGNEMFC